MLIILGIIAILLIIILIIQIRHYRETKINDNAITPNDAAIAILHKALRHLSRACKAHQPKCRRYDDLKGYIGFADGVLDCNTASKGLETMGNLEDAAANSHAQAKELAKALYILLQNPDDRKLAEDVLNNFCACGIEGVPCRLHKPKQDPEPRL